jgi:hypothetical protein
MSQSQWPFPRPARHPEYPWAVWLAWYSAIAGWVLLAGLSTVAFEVVSTMVFGYGITRSLHDPSVLFPVQVASVLLMPAWMLVHPSLLAFLRHKKVFVAAQYWWPWWACSGIALGIALAMAVT